MAFWNSTIQYETTKSSKHHHVGVFPPAPSLLLTREGRVHGQHALLFIALELVLVQIFLQPWSRGRNCQVNKVCEKSAPSYGIVAGAKEEMAGSHLLAFSVLADSLLDNSNELNIQSARSWSKTLKASQVLKHQDEFSAISMVGRMTQGG